MERLYCYEYWSPYCVTDDHIGHAFVLAESKSAITVCQNERLLAVRVATQEDVDRYGKGDTRQQIFDRLRKTNIMLRGR